MTLPQVTVSKNIFSTSQAPPSSTGVLAIVAASSTGTAYQVGAYSRSDLAVNDYGYGPLTDYAAYDISVANEPTVLVKTTPTYPGVLGSLTLSMGSSTSVPSNNASTPFDTYNVVVTFPAGGTIGTAGITYTVSTDGGQTNGGVQQLGTATTINVPNTGLSFTMGAGTVVAGSSFQAYSTRPMAGDSDVTTALGVLGTTRAPFEGILVDSSATSSTVGLIDAVLASWEQRGMFKFVILNSRYKTEPEPTAESESAYATALQTTFGSSASARMCVGADGAHVPSTITGWNLKRPTGLLLAARAMQTPIGEDAAYVARGPLTGAQISDPRGNPFDHDEDLYPNLDALRLVSLRSFAPGGPQGVYITNANTIAPSGSNVVYLQHIRILNRAAEIAWAVLTAQLSVGVRKNPKPDPVTGVVTIFEPDAARIESLVNDALQQPLKGQVSAAKFTLSRTDDLNAIPAQVNGLLEIVALAYVKKFLVQAQFSKTITSAI